MASKTRAPVLTCVLVSLVLTSCATVPQDAGFDEVRATIAERTGGASVSWHRGGEADAQVAEQLRSLWADGDFTAAEAVQVALLNNRRLQATYESLMVAQADLVAAGLLPNPLLESQVRFPEGGGRVGLEIAVVQEFLSIFQIPLRKKVAAASFEAAKQRVALEVVDVAGSVREAYYSLVAAKQLLELRGSVVDATEAAHAMAQRLYEAGNVTDLELNLQRVEYEQAKLNFADAEFEVIARRESLNRALGLWGPDANAWEVQTRLPEMPEMLDGLEDLERRAVAESLALAATRHEIEATAGSLGLRRNFNVVPEASVGAVGERETEGDWTFGPTMEMPIPLFDQGQPEVAAAVAELRRARARYFAEAVELRSAARAARALLQNTHSRVTYYQKVVLPLRAEVVEQTQLHYNAMQVGVFQLLDVRRQQIQAGVKYIEALREYWLAQSAMQTLLSGGTAGSDAPSRERSEMSGGESVGGGTH